MSVFAICFASCNFIHTFYLIRWSLHRSLQTLWATSLQLSFWMYSWECPFWCPLLKQRERCSCRRGGSCLSTSLSTRIVSYRRLVLFLNAVAGYSSDCIVFAACLWVPFYFYLRILDSEVKWFYFIWWSLLWPVLLGWRIDTSVQHSFMALHIFIFWIPSFLVFYPFRGRRISWVWHPLHLHFRT